MPTLYRRGNHTPMNFTPRFPEDTVGNARGLSVRLDHGDERNQVIDSDLLVAPLSAIATPIIVPPIPGHYSIRPNPDDNDALLIAWAKARPGINPNTWALPNPTIPDLTNNVNGARTGQIN